MKKSDFVYSSGTPSAPKISERAFAAAEDAFGRPADLDKRDGPLTVNRPPVDPDARRRDFTKA
jgi:hypothetical protein